MLLSPLASPNAFRPSFARQLPPLHDSYDNDDNDNDASEESDSPDEFQFEFGDDDDSESSASESGDDDEEDIQSMPSFSCGLELGVMISTPSSAPMKVQLELALPVELILTIIELAASTHHRTALTLCRVSSWIRNAVLPTLYRVMLIHEDRDKPAVTPNPSLVPPPAPPLETLPYRSVFDVSEGKRWPEESKRADALQFVKSLWVDVPSERAPHSLDTFPNLVQLALPLEAHKTICNSERLREVWEAQQAQEALDADAEVLPIDGGEEDGERACGDKVWNDEESELSNLDPAVEFQTSQTLPETGESTTCRSFTVLGQSHPHRWTPLTASVQGQAFLRNVTHLRLLNLCLSHYIPLEYTPSLTHLCLPFFDIRTDEPLVAAVAAAEPSHVTTSPFSSLDHILTSPYIPHLKMLVLTLNPHYWRFEERTLKGWALSAMSRDVRVYVIAETREDATRDWECARRDWEDEAKAKDISRRNENANANRGGGRHGGVGGIGEEVEMGGVWAKAVEVRRKFLTRASKSFN